MYINKHTLHKIPTFIQGDLLMFLLAETKMASTLHVPNVVSWSLSLCVCV